MLFCNDVLDKERDIAESFYTIEVSGFLGIPNADAVGIVNQRKCPLVVLQESIFDLCKVFVFSL